MTTIADAVEALGLSARPSGSFESAAAALTREVSGAAHEPPAGSRRSSSRDLSSSALQQALSGGRGANSAVGGAGTAACDSDGDESASVASGETLASVELDAANETGAVDQF